MSTTVTPKGLKGFADFRILPTVDDTPTEYSATGTQLLFVGADSCTVADNREDFSIPGDDGVYDSGSEWKDSDVEVTIHQVDLESIAKLTGCTIDEAKTAIEEGTLDVSDAVAILYRALRRDKKYRCYRYYNCKLVSYSVDHKTKGTSNDGQPYKLKFKCLPRKIDGMVRGTADVDTLAAADTWLSSIPTVTPSSE